MATSAVTTLGIDVGGTKIAAGLVTFPDGRVSPPQIIPTATPRGGEAVLDDVVRLAEALTEAARNDGSKVSAIGLGLCELVDPSGKILSSNCVHWQGQPVLERLSQVAPVVLEADVRAAALAEARFGAGRPFRVFLYITVGTGISCCLMIDGKPLIGAQGATGTMASSPIGVTCERCGHLSNRTLEEISSGPALVAQLNQRQACAATKAEDVFAAATAGKIDALAVLRSGGQALGTTTGLLVGVFDPEAVIVGGGLGLRDGPFWNEFVESTRRHIWSQSHRDIPIVHAATGSNAGIIGAAAAAWNRLKA